MTRMIRTYRGSKTIYALIQRTADGHAWNGSEFELYDNDNRNDYAIVLTTLGGLLYGADFPAEINVAVVISYYERDGSTASVTDLVLGTELVDPSSAVDDVSTADELTAAQIQAKISAINAQLATFVSTSGSGNDIRALDVEIKHSQRIKALQEERKFWTQLLRDTPATEVFYYDRS